MSSGKRTEDAARADDDELPRLDPEADPDIEIDDGPTPVDPPPDMLPPRPEQSYARAVAEAAADQVLRLQHELVETRARAEAAEERSGCLVEATAVAELRVKILTEQVDVLGEENERLRARSGELAAEVVRLKGRVNRLIEDLKKRR